MTDGAGTLLLDLDGFEGPLDLLLALARAQKVDLKRISIMALVDQYLAFITRAEALRLEVAADHLVMAAWLAFLKSAMLLPRHPEAQPDPEELVLRLQRRLERLERLDAMRGAGATLLTRDLLGRDVFARGDPTGLHTARRAVWQASLYDLLAAYGQVTARRRPATHIVADRQVMTLETALARVSAMLSTQIGWARLDRFLADLRGAGRRSAMAASFLAVLELARQGRVELRQAVPLAPIEVRMLA